MLEIVVADIRFVARFEEEAAPADRGRVPAPAPVRGAGSSTAAGAASRTGSRSATSSSASAPRTRRATRARRAAALPGGRQRDGAPLPVRRCSFASKAGPLAGNHFATIVEGGEQLRELGRLHALGGRAGRSLFDASASRPTAQRGREHVDGERDVLVARQLVGRVADARRSGCARRASRSRRRVTASTPASWPAPDGSSTAASPSRSSSSRSTARSPSSSATGAVARLGLEPECLEQARRAAPRRARERRRSAGRGRG